MAKTPDVVRWFAECGDRYVKANLSHIDLERLVRDRDYGLKLFLFHYAFERSGAPRGYRIAAVKAVSSLMGSQEELPDLFKKFYAGKLNAKLNPALDPRTRDLDVPSIVRLVEEGLLLEAFQKLKLKGVGHKIRAFFLRDLVILLDSESELGGDREAYLCCQPIDVWVRFVAEELCGNAINTALPGSTAKLELSKDDQAAALGIIDLSMGAGVSPLSVNQGIWYFSANAVADETRLRKLIGSRDYGKLDDELALMEGFLPAQPMWG